MSDHTPGQLAIKKWDTRWVVTHPFGIVCITSQGNDKANAARIMQTWNVHDDLVGIVEVIADRVCSVRHLFIPRQDCKDRTDDKDDWCLVCFARATLKLTKETT